MATYKIVVERNDCTSCGICEQECPDFFELDDENLSHIKGSNRVGDNDELEVEDAGCVPNTAILCPAFCIHVYEDGKEIS